MFDCLVCMNGGNPREDLIEHKNTEKAMALEHAAEWKQLSQNHLEGRSAGFFCYGDGGGDEIDDSGRPIILRHKEWFDPEKEPFEEVRQAYAPLVWQCRYAGIEVPEGLWEYCESGRGVPYSDNQAEDLLQRPENAGFLRAFDAWASRFAAFAQKKERSSRAVIAPSGMKLRAIVGPTQSSNGVSSE